jgi:hypothetical protein
MPSLASVYNILLAGAASSALLFKLIYEAMRAAGRKKMNDRQ